MRFLSFFILLLIVNICSFGQINQSYQSPSSCLDLQIEVLAEPFCQGSVNGGQLKVNVTPGSGSGDYSYEWLDDNGGFLPGGPQTNATTLSFLTANQIYWVYVTDNVTNCYDSVSYIFEDYSCQEDTASLEVDSPFDINPVGYNQYSECDIKLLNLGCQLNFKPEFIISHESEDIDLGDFIVEFYNAQSIWESISYSINSSGDAVGYWGSESGETLNCDYGQVIRPVRVKFNQFDPTAPTGEYTATLRLWSVDENGDPLSIVSEDAYVSLTLIDTICEDLTINSQFTNASCSGVNDAQITLSGSGGNEPYLFSLSNSEYSTDSVFNLLTNGTYFAAIKDANDCQNSDTIIVGPAPVLPDSLWFSSVYPFSANIVWNVDSLADGYKFRYREVGQSWQGPVASGNYSNGIAEMFPNKTLTGLTPATTYEVQVKANSLTGCEEGWSTEIYTFTTPMEVYVYNVDNTCVGINSGQIEFEVITNNSYTFDWQGPNSFSSTDTSIYNLAEGDYNLQISNGQNIIFDSTFVVSVSDSDIGVTLNGDPSLVSYSAQDGVYFAQACDLTSYIIADSGYSNYSWHYGESLNYVQAQQILIDTSNVFIQVEALDSNNCALTSDSIHISIISDYVNLINANGNEDYIDDVYVLCSADSSVNIDISPFITGDYSVEWREIMGTHSILLSENPSIEIITNQSTAYTLNVSSCSFDFFINYYPSPSLEVQHTNLLCYGDTNATIYIQTDSPTSINYSLIDSIGNEIYFNNSNLPSDTIENVAAGLYTVELKDESLCAVSQEIEVIQPDPFVLDSILVTDVICNADSTGVFEAYFTGGTPDFSYLFNNDTSILANELYAGSYYVEISDSNGCTIDTNFTVDEPNELILSTIDSLTSNVSCFGNNDGQIGLESSGGVPPYQYSILGSSAQDTNVIIELFADTFIVSVTDSVGCQDTLTVIISQPELNLFIDSYELSDSLGFCALCYGDSTGFIDILLTGGTPAYNYFIVNEPDTFTSSHIEKLVGGEEYQFFAMDAQGCLTDTITVECTSPDELILDIETAMLPSCCYSCDSEVILLAEGGITPYTYGFEEEAFQSDSLFNQLCGDSSYVFKILDSHGCEKHDSSIIVENRPCLTVDTLNYVNNGLPALVHYDICQEDGTAKIYTTALEGVGSYSFSIDGEPFIQQDEIMFDGLFQGSHYLVVKDELNCLDTLNFELEAPNPIIISDLFIDTIFCGAPTINNMTNQSDIGSIHATASGGLSGVYFYSLDEIDSLLYQPTGLFDDLDSGYYSMNVIDLNDCVEEFDIYIPFYSASVEYTISDITCPDFNNGIIEIDTIIGGFNPWVTFDGNTTTNNSFMSISEGEHNLTIHYFVPNSSEICSYTETIEFFDQEPLDFSYELKNPTCYGICNGSISVDQISGGTNPYTILCLNTADTNLIFEDLCADEYAIKIVDSNGCFIIQDIVMTEPNAIYPIIGFEDGQLAVLEPTLGSPFSGIPPYSYQWYDSNGQILGETDSLYEPALPGVYSVVVTDDTDCIGESSLYKIEVLAMSNWDSDLVDVYPNPFKDVLKVSTDSKNEIDWIISDTRGRIVQLGQDTFSWTINTSELYNGIYFLRLKEGDNELIYKIVKQ